MQGFEKRALGYTASLHFLVHLTELAFGALLVRIALEFGAGLAAMGLLASVLGFSFGISSLPAGFLADRINERRLLAACALGIAAGAVTVGLAPNEIVLGAGLLVLGLSMGLYHPSSLSYIARIMTRRGLGFGWLGVGGNLGTALGPVIAVSIAAVLSWRASYLVLAVPAVIVAALFFTTGRGEPARQVAVKGGPQPGAAGNVNLRPMLLALALVFIAQMLNGFVYRGVVTFLPVYLGERLNVSLGGLDSVVVAGSFTTVALVFGVGGQFLGGWLSERRRSEVLALVVALTATPMLFVMGLSSGLVLMGAAALFAFFYFMSQPVYNSLVANYSPGNRRGLLYGLSFFSSFGMGAFSATFLGYIGQQSGTNWVFLAAGVCSALTLVCATYLLVLAKRRG